MSDLITRARDRDRARRYQAAIVLTCAVGIIAAVVLALAIAAARGAL